MNYLEIAQRSVLEGGASGRGVSIAGASGEWLRFVTWVNQAWQDIQNEHSGSWLWMRKTKSFPTVAEQGEYTLSDLSITDFASWHKDSFRVYKDTVGNETYLPYLPYNMFRDIYLISNVPTTYSMPSVMTISPIKSIVLALPPNDASYVITGDYQSTPAKLTLDADTPAMPERFHMAIVWKALMYYAAYESYPEKYSTAEREYKRIRNQLEIDQLPEITINRSFL